LFWGLFLLWLMFNWKNPLSKSTNRHIAKTSAKLWQNSTITDPLPECRVPKTIASHTVPRVWGHSNSSKLYSSVTLGELHHNSRIRPLAHQVYWPGSCQLQISWSNNPSKNRGLRWPSISLPDQAEPNSQNP
jgi:hypothetical protein